MAVREELSQYRRDRQRLLARLQAGGIEDLAILHAFDAVPRHLFVPRALHARAYEDAALPIGHGQTISRPSVHASHLILASIRVGDRVLEIGTGSGFQTALLHRLGARVFSIEVVRELSERAARVLEKLEMDVLLRIGDGNQGWPEAAPFNVILVGAAAARLPPALLQQLAPAGRLIAPVGDGCQELVRVLRTDEGWSQETLDAARFVPLI